MKALKEYWPYILAGIALFLFTRPAQAVIRQGSNSVLDETGKLLQNLTRGERNNNPGNIRPNSAYSWQGQTGSDGSYLTFSDPAYGIRAIAKDVINKSNRGLDTIAKIISAWAPPSDNNPTAKYIQFVADQLGLAADDSIDLSDPDTLQQFITAMIRFENGRVIYDASVISNGVQMAMTG